MMFGVPICYPDERHYLVTKVRETLNIPSDDRLDGQLQVLLKGFQKANGIEAHGAIDPVTLSKLDIWYY